MRDNLYNRLKEEHKIQLLKNQSLFEYSVERVIEDLKKNTTWTKIEFGNAIQLLNFTTNELISINRIDDLFNK